VVGVLFWIGSLISAKDQDRVLRLLDEEPYMLGVCVMRASIEHCDTTPCWRRWFAVAKKVPGSAAIRGLRDLCFMQAPIHKRGTPILPVVAILDELEKITDGRCASGCGAYGVQDVSVVRRPVNAVARYRGAHPGTVLEFATKLHEVSLYHNHRDTASHFQAQCR